jgi:hypothetical protein
LEGKGVGVQADDPGPNPYAQQAVALKTCREGRFRLGANQENGSEGFFFSRRIEKTYGQHK